MEAAEPDFSDSPDVIKRMQFVLKHHTRMLRNESSTASRRASFLLEKFVEETLEECEIIPPEILEYYLKQGSAALYWAATGMLIENMPLDESLAKEVASNFIIPIDEVQSEQLELTS